MADKLSGLDANQVIRRSGTALDMSQGVPDTGLSMLSVGGTLVPERYDENDYTYVTSGNGIGEIETIVYKYQSVTICTVTFTYDASNRVINRVRTNP